MHGFVRFFTYILFLSIAMAEYSAGDGWSKLQLSPQIFASIPFSSYRVKIYQHSWNNQTTNHLKQYFYAPLSLLNRSAIACRWSNVTDEYEVSFQIIMWTNEENTELVNRLEPIAGFRLRPDQLQILPFERVTLKSTKASEKFRVSTQWKSYVSQPQTVSFAVMATDQTACKLISEQLQTHPDHFDYLHIYFALESQVSERREATITIQHVLNGKFYQKLRQFSGSAESVYLTTEDEAKLLSETSNIIFIESFEDLEILESNQEIRIWNEVRQLLTSTRANSNEFNDLSWNLVFWSDISYRPDKLARRVNQVYKDSTFQKKTEMELVFSADDDHDSTKRNSYIKNATWPNSAAFETPEAFDIFMHQAKLSVTWNGEKFVPKPMTLRKISLASQSNAHIQSRNVKVKYSSSVLRTNINYLPQEITAALASGSYLKVTVGTTQTINSISPNNLTVDLSQQMLQSCTTRIDSRLKETEQQMTSLRQEILENAQQQAYNFTSVLRNLEASIRKVEESLHMVVNQSMYPCHKTTLHVTGPKVTTKLGDAPIGTVCIGNTAGPSPGKNFLVFRKRHATSEAGAMLFLGTQSVNQGFIDFTKFVTWSFWTSAYLANREAAKGYTEPVTECNLLPSRLRGSYNGTDPGCSRNNTIGHVYLVHPNNHDAVVDDDGAITVVRTYTETLWY